MNRDDREGVVTRLYDMAAVAASQVVRAEALKRQLANDADVDEEVLSIAIDVKGHYMFLVNQIDKLNERFQELYPRR